MPASGTKLRVLIAIPSYRRPDGLRKLLASLAAQQQVGHVPIELFVADNDSRQREAESACRELAPNFRWPLACELVEERGISAARNAILDRARQSGVDFVAMLDDDEIAEPNWLSELLAAQERTDADVLGGPVRADFGSKLTPAMATSGLFGLSGGGDGSHDVLHGAGNVLISCACLDRIGWPRFDLAFGTTGGEDKEFFTRIAKLGVAFSWASLAVVREEVPDARAKMSWIVRRAFRVGNNDLRITRMHKGGVATSTSVAKAVVALATAPLCSPLLLAHSRRWQIIALWARSAGKLAALMGRAYHEYGY